MKINRVFRAQFLIALLAVLAAGALSVHAQETVDLRATVWTGNQTQLDLLNGIAAAYSEQNPNITVTFESIPNDEYVSKVTLQLAGSNPPDLGWLGDGNVRAFVRAGALVDLAPTLQASESFDFSDLSQPPMSVWTYDSSVYGVPFSSSPFFIIYNADLFAAAGIPNPAELIAEGNWTWDTFAESARAIAEANADDGIYGFESLDAAVFTSNPWGTLNLFMIGQGGAPWNVEGTECLLNSPESVAGLDLFHRMVFEDNSAVPPGTSADFFTGSAGMTIGQLSRLGKLNEATFAWDIVPLPTSVDGETDYIIGQAAFVAFAGGNHPEEAADFLAFLTNPENSAQLATFWPSIRNSVLDANTIQNNNPSLNPESVEAAVVTGIRQGTQIPFPVEFQRINLLARPLLDTLWTPDADVQTVTNDICAAIDPFLQ
jgi:multiple sugar transport system substrate-binding protein